LTIRKVKIFKTQKVSTKGNSNLVKSFITFEDNATAFRLESIVTTDAFNQKELIFNNLFKNIKVHSKLTHIGRKFFDIGSKQQIDSEQ
jgi:hypothetical protein